MFSRANSTAASKQPRLGDSNSGAASPYNNGKMSKRMGSTGSSFEKSSTRKKSPSGGSARRGGAAGMSSAHQGPALTAEAAAALDELRDATTGLLARHLDQPLLTQPLLTSPTTSRGQGAATSDAESMTATEAEQNVTANFFKSLPSETKRLYDNAAVAAYARRREVEKDKRHNKEIQGEIQGTNGFGNSARGDGTGREGGGLHSHSSVASGALTPQRGDESLRTSPADDCITAQTLHLLLGKSRTTAERILPPALATFGGRYYSFDAGLRRGEKEVTMTNPLVMESKRVAGSLERMNASVKHQEPAVVGPSVQSAKYYYNSSSNGISQGGIDSSSSPASTAATASLDRTVDRAEAVDLAESYFSRRPDPVESQLLQYPPIPVQYANVDERKQALTRKRLGLPRANAKAAGTEEGFESANSAIRTVAGSARRPDSKKNMAAAELDAIVKSSNELYNPNNPKRPSNGKGQLAEISSGFGGSSYHNRGYDEEDLSQQGNMEWAQSYVPRDFDLVDAPTSRLSTNATLQFALTTAATRGEDGSLVQQLVKLYGAQLTAETQRRRQQRSMSPSSMAFAASTSGKEKPATLTADSLRNSTKSAKPSASPGSKDVFFPMLEAVLSVSREFDAVRETAAHATLSGRGPETTLGGSTPAAAAAGSASWLSAGAVAHERQDAVARLTSFASTKIPEQYWVTVQQRAALSARLGNSGMGKETSAKQAFGKTATALSSPAHEQSMRNEEALRSSRDTTPSLGQRAASRSCAEHDPCDTSARASPDRYREFGSAAEGDDKAPGGTLSHSATVARASCEAQVDIYASANDSKSMKGVTPEGLVVFPAPRPAGRAQVYLLAETLDHMLSVEPTWLNAIADRETAYAILPPTTTTGPAASADMDNEHANPLLDPDVQWRSHQAYELYTNAAAHVLDVLDVGLVEIVRQISVQCVERGALLDTLRQTVVDIAESHVRVLAYTKERAFEEATMRVAIREELDDMRERLAGAMATIQSLRQDQQIAEEEKAALRTKADRFDELVARVEAKRKRYEIHSEEAHTRVLEELEKQMKQSASEALNNVFEERLRLAGLKGSNDGDEGTGANQDRSNSSSSPQDGTSSPTNAENGANITEAPSAEEARKRVSEEKKAAGKLYRHSHQLLRALHEATEAMNAASAPLYDNVILKAVSPAANVATARWASVARALGAFEKEKAHRERVFAVFCDWCDCHQKARLREKNEHQQQQGSEEPDRGANDDDEAPVDGEENISTAAALRKSMQSHKPDQGDFLLASQSSSADDNNGKDDGNRDNHGSNPQPQRTRLRAASVASFASLPSGTAQLIRDSADQTVAQVKREQREAEKLTDNAHQLRDIEYITSVDLLEMNVRDCSAEEVNKLFANGFDFRKYLNPVWKPRSQQQEMDSDAEAGKLISLPDGSHAVGANGDAPALTGEWSFTLSDIAEMVQDVQATLHEMTLRMRAMSNSAILQKGVQPPMQPPERPEDPCQLCGRCDTFAEERKRRQDALRQIAREVQQRLEALTEKCQHAEAEREDARGDARRLLVEVDQLKQQEKRLLQELRDRAMEQEHSRLSFSDNSVSKSPRRRGSMNSGGTETPTVFTPSPTAGVMQPRGIIRRRGSGSSASSQRDKETTSLNSSTARSGAGAPHAGTGNLRRRRPTGTVAFSTRPPGRRRSSLNSDSGPTTAGSNPSTPNSSGTQAPQRRSTGRVSLLDNPTAPRPGSGVNRARIAEPTRQTRRRSGSLSSSSMSVHNEEEVSVDDPNVDRRHTLPPSASPPPALDGKSRVQ